jgi:protein O-GlcNAc transferase
MKSDDLMNGEIERLIQEGLSLLLSGQKESAEVFFLRLIENYPYHGDAYNLLGCIYGQEKKFKEAKKLFEIALSIDPNNPVYNSNFGNTLQDLGNVEESLIYYQRAIQGDPFLIDAYYNCGNALRKLERYSEALEYLNKTKQLNKNYTKCYIAVAHIYENIKDYDKSLNELLLAYELEGNNFEVLSDLAIVYSKKNDFEKAVFFFKKAFETGKADASFFSNYGAACVEMLNPKEAISAYLQCAAISPGLNGCLGRALHQKMIIADWSNINEINAEIVKRIKLGENVVDPFGYMGFSDSESDLQKVAAIDLKEKTPLISAPALSKKYSRKKKIKIAYVSGEFREHANGSLMTGLIECHDKNKFEVIGLDNGNSDDSLLRSRLLNAFDEHKDIRRLADLELIQWIRYKEIDILFNLNGFFGEHRTGIFANRSAPIQINFLGCPGTMGVDFMDYLVADSVVIPKSSYDFYNEKIILLPHSYQINDSKRPELKRNLTKQASGLPEGVLVFCCFNNIYKVTPATFKRWMRILNRVPRSVLWFYNNFPEAEANLKREAVALGIDASRLIFSPYIPMYDHLERYHLADLFLDSLPYNAHTSGSDALWANLPVLTLQGKSFAGRVGASLLHAIGMPELITYTEQEFEDKAVDLATHPEKLAALKIKLSKNRLTTPLFDTKLYTKHFESALIEAYERYQSDLPPAHIQVMP